MPEPAPLLLVVGPSGAGKDTLLAAARERLAGDSRFVFVRRVITRPANAGGENHTPATCDELKRHAEAGEFSLHWEAHGLKYGIPGHYEADRRAGRRVIANVSRRVIDLARCRLAPVRTILVTAPDHVLAARLAARGRESAAEIRRRLARSVPEVTAEGQDVTVVDNGGTLEEGISAFMHALRP